MTTSEWHLSPFSAILQHTAMVFPWLTNVYGPWFLAPFVVWLIARLMLHRARRQASIPPGPRPWPVIGNLNLLGKRPHRSIHKLLQTYGPLMQLKFGSTNVVVTNSPNTAREFLKTYDSKFASRPQLSAGKYITYNFSDLTWGSYGPHWRQGRKIFATHIFNSKKIELYEYIRVEERDKFLARLYNLRGEKVRIRDHLSHINLDIMTRIVLGKKYFSDSKHQQELADGSIMTLKDFEEMLDEFFLLNGVLVIGDWIPWLGWLDLNGYVKRMKILGKKFDQFLDFVIKEHLMAREGHGKVAKDILDTLLDLLDDPQCDVNPSIDHVKGFTQELLTGGTDTSSITVEWALSELMKNPEKMKKVKEELNMVIGQERWVEEKDMPNLPYLQAIIKETLRLHPVSTLLAPHYAMEDCQIQNYNISKGTLIFINTWSMARDPTVWDYPEEFRPERFLNLDNPIDINGKHYELLPFGSGRRMCPGYAMGTKFIQSSLANLIHGFNWKLPDNMLPQDLSMEEIYGLTSPREYPLVAIMEPRLSSKLYT